jgi:hypothetical protein
LFAAHFQNSGVRPPIAGFQAIAEWSYLVEATGEITDAIIGKIPLFTVVVFSEIESKGFVRGNLVPGTEQ